MKIVIALLIAIILVIGYLYFNPFSEPVAQNQNIDVRSTADSVIHSVSTTASSREISQAERINLPLKGSAPEINVTHSIPIEEIRQGCFRQDCIPSVDNPNFVGIEEADTLVPDDMIGIGLSYNDTDRFYPFGSLATREIVNDVVAGDPLLVTYCPLCGTGIVFRREIDGEAVEFGVSGMLWQSNLLMYDRSPDVADRSLWSQVLGEAVVGARTGTKLEIIPSDIVEYKTWKENHPDGEVLFTGSVRDPYGGDYYRVARQFGPNFDESDSPLTPSTYVYGIELDGSYKAYPRDELPVGETRDTLNGVSVVITKNEDGTALITDETGNIIPDVEGFWFSWVAAYPETTLWTP